MPVNRRQFLRGAATAIALPFLESRPASPSDTGNSNPRRVFFMYTPNGVIASQWKPTQIGSDWVAKGSLAPLKSVREQVTVLSGLSRKKVPGQVHGQACCCWLTSATPGEELPGPFPINTTLDQIIARDKGDQTLYPSIALSCNDFTDNHESVYFDSVSWKGPGQPVLASKEPRRVFNRLFRVSEDSKASQSVLDAVLSDARSLKRKLSRNDTVRIDDFMEGIRETERMLQRREAVLKSAGPISIAAPEETPERRGEYIRMMCSLICHAFEMDLSRVATLVVDPERWSSPRMFHGVFNTPQNHHMLTHDNSPDAAAKVAAIDRFHVELFAEVVKRLASMKGSGGRSLLDECLVVMGSGLGDGYTHSLDNLPILLGGSAGGRFTTGQHIEAEAGTPLANLWRMVRSACGADSDKFADSTGTIAGLAQ